MVMMRTVVMMVVRVMVMRVVMMVVVMLGLPFMTYLMKFPDDAAS